MSECTHARVRVLPVCQVCVYACSRVCARLLVQLMTESASKLNKASIPSFPIDFGSFPTASMEPLEAKWGLMLNPVFDPPPPPPNSRGVDYVLVKRARDFI